MRKEPSLDPADRWLAAHVEDHPLDSIAEAPPAGEGWVSEIKFDGYRIDHGEVRLLTRNGHDWADRLPAVAKAVAALGVRTALLDGELVAVRESGASSFPDLQAALSDGNDSQLTFFLFDLLHLNGWDLRPCALRDRKQALAALADWGGILRYSDHVEGHTAELRRRPCGMGLTASSIRYGVSPALTMLKGE